MTTFGGVELREDGAPHLGAATQRRRLALLVLLGSARAPVARDKLVAWLWPDHPSEQARHSLRQALHTLQRSLPGVVLVSGENLALDPARIATDVGELEDAALAGAEHAIVTLYRGPFLDGFFLNDAPAFERWTDGQRVRYAGLFTAALESLAGRATRAGNHVEAIGWWRRLTGEDSLNARYALGLMRALADAQDRAGALRYAGVYAGMMRQELGAAVDPAVEAFARRLREAEPESTEASSPAPLVQTRERARHRQRTWLERTFADRYLLAPSSPGGTAVVSYRARRLDGGDEVEIHLLDPGLSVAADPDRLLASLERVAQMRSPRMGPLLEVGSADGVVYYVTSRPPGETLREKLGRERQLPLPEAVAITDGIGEALEAAHAGGVRHGDLRPRHVHVNDGDVVVAGFGIADALLDATRSDRSSAMLRFGSPAYQSPEQLSGDPRLDERSDLYSLGCILYEMLAGEVPFASADRPALIHGKLTGGAASVRPRRDSVSDALDRVVSRCLARSPADRFPSATALRAALHAATHLPA